MVRFRKRNSAFQPGYSIVLMLVLVGASGRAVAFEAGPCALAPASENVVSTTPSTICRIGAVDGVPIQNEPETLQEAWTVALAVDRGLGAKRFGVAAAQESLLSARAERRPSMALEGSYAVRDSEQAFQFYPQGLPLPDNLRFPFLQQDGFAFRSRVDVPLYTSGTIREGIGAAEAELKTADLDLAGARRDLMLQVAEVYLAVLGAERDVEVADRTVITIETHLRDARTALASRRATHNDVLATQTAVAEARQAAVRARNLLDIRRAAYNRRLGRPLTSPVWLADVPLEIPRDGVETLTGRALAARPTLARLQAEIQVLEHQAAGQLGKNGPQVSLWGEYAFEENRYTVPEGIGEAGLAVTWNVWDGGRDRHRAAALRQQAEALRAARDDLQSTIALDVRSAWLDVQQACRQVDVSLETIRRAEENVRVVRQRCEAAMGTDRELLDAELLEKQSQRNHAHAYWDAVFATLRLRHATGEMAP